MGMGMGMVVVAVVSVAGCLVVVSLAFLPSFALSSSLSAFPIFLSHFGRFFCCQFFEGFVDLFFKICFFSISIFFRMVLGKLGPSPIWRQIGPALFGALANWAPADWALANWPLANRASADWTPALKERKKYILQLSTRRAHRHFLIDIYPPIVCRIYPIPHQHLMLMLFMR